MAEHVCPVWVGHLLASPVRRLFQNPEKILRGLVNPGMTVLDVGCAMGFFSIPMAKMVGPGGRVVCVDLQEGMFRSLAKRARRAKVTDRIETRVCTPESLRIDDLGGTIDFALAFAVVHESPAPAGLLSQVCQALARGGKLLVAEPKAHVPAEAFQETLDAAGAAGLVVVDRPPIRRSMTLLLQKPARC